MSVKLSNVAHPVSVVAAGVSPQPTSDASIDTASSTGTSSGSNAMDHAGKQITVLKFHAHSTLRNLDHFMHVRHLVHLTGRSCMNNCRPFQASFKVLQLIKH